MQQQDSSRKYRLIIFLLLVIILALGFLFFLVWRAGLISPNTIPVEDQTSQLEPGAEQIDTEEDEQNDLDQVQEITFLPFEFTFSLPADWTVETIETGWDSSSGKCLTHLVSSPGDFARLEVVPFCGPYGGAPEPCPDGTEIIGEIGDDDLARYPDPSSNPATPKISYTNAADNYCVGFMINSAVALKVTAGYNGPNSEWPRYLGQLDQIVLSLAE